ncbi:unnamed protein product [Rhodiola kirilowii]
MVSPVSSPRISFSADGLEDTDDFISINLLSNKVMKEEDKRDLSTRIKPDFEFLSSDRSGGGPDMITADELFYEGKLLPFWQMHHSDKLKKISLKTKEAGEEVTEGAAAVKEESSRVGNWFVDDDPSPRPPNCTVLWKELLRLKKKQRASTLSPSSSSSSSSSSSVDMSSVKEDNAGNKEQNSKTARKGLERTKSATISSRIRPMVNVPICKTQGGSRISSLPPLIPLRKARLDI